MQSLSHVCREIAVDLDARRMPSHLHPPALQCCLLADMMPLCFLLLFLDLMAWISASPTQLLPYSRPCLFHCAVCTSCLVTCKLSGKELPRVALLEVCGVAVQHHVVSNDGSALQAM